MENHIIKRYKKNPILTKKDVPYPVETVHNAGVIKFNGKYVMLFRSHLNTGRSIIGKAESPDGLKFKVSSEPFMTGQGESEEYGVEDPRIAEIDNEFFISYSAYSRFGVRIGLAKTNDFENINRISYITQADTRNLVLFTEKINNKFVRLDRPHSEINPWSIWISFSPDLIHWGESKCIITPKTYHWTESKVGPGATPIKTEKGWLNIFHGVFTTMNGGVYRLGVALHDLRDPSNILGVYDGWILAPEDPWELTGYVPNVVFSCGAVKENDGTIKIYWGASDTVMCVGEAKINDLINLCLNNTSR